MSDRARPRRPRPSPSASSPGRGSTAATSCPGRTRATRTASGSRRSCCSRRRSRPCSATTSASSRASPTSPRSRPPRSDDVLAAVERPRLLQPRAQPASLRAGRRRPSTAASSRRRARRWRELPGIGRSTAAAIAAFCFGERVAILDGNVKRVLARVLAFEGDLAEARARARALGARRPRCCRRATSSRYTQGLMDLGATVCRARAPHCLLCPAARRLRRGARRHAGALPDQVAPPRPRPARERWLELAGATRSGCSSGRDAVSGPASGACPSSTRCDAFDERRLRGWPGQAEMLSTVRPRSDPFRLAPAAGRWTFPARRRRALAALLARWPDGRWLTRDAALALGLPAPLRRLLQSRRRRPGPSRRGARRRCNSPCSAHAHLESTTSRRTSGSASAISFCLASIGDRQDLAPAVRNPAGVVEPVRLRGKARRLAPRARRSRRPGSCDVRLARRRRDARRRPRSASSRRATGRRASWRLAPTSKRSVPRQRTCRMPACALSTSSISA